MASLIIFGAAAIFIVKLKSPREPTSPLIEMDDLTASSVILPSSAFHNPANHDSDEDWQHQINEGARLNEPAIIDHSEEHIESSNL